MRRSELTEETRQVATKKNCALDCVEIQKLNHRQNFLMGMVVALFIMNVFVDGAIFFKVTSHDKDITFLSKRSDIQRGEIDDIQRLHMDTKK